MSMLLSDELKSMGKFLHKRNATRWNSVYMMINSYLSLSYSDIKSLISMHYKNKNISEQRNLLLSQIEIDKLKELQLILHDFYICTQIIQGDDVTISKLLTSIRTVKYNLEQLNLIHLDNLRRTLIENISQKFKYIEEDELFTYSSIIDPNYTFNFLSKIEREKWLKKFKNFVDVHNDNAYVISSLQRKKVHLNVGLIYLDLIVQTKMMLTQNLLGSTNI